MKKTEAIKLVANLAFMLGKMRSNAIEALGGAGASWDDLQEVERRVLEVTQPGLFGKDGRPSIFDVALKLVDKGEDLNPNDLYNLLYVIERDGAVKVMISFMWPDTVLPKVSPPPTWIMQFDQDRPKVVCLCGSTRYMSAFYEANRNETIAGNIVLSIGVNLKADSRIEEGMSTQEIIELKKRLDELHRAKIDLADEILVLNVDGYIGTSTKAEIDYAIAEGKVVRYLNMCQVCGKNPAAEDRDGTCVDCSH